MCLAHPLNNCFCIQISFHFGCKFVQKLKITYILRINRRIHCVYKFFHILMNKLNFYKIIIIVYDSIDSISRNITKILTF